MKYKRYLKTTFGFDAWSDKLWPGICNVVRSSLTYGRQWLEPLHPGCFQLLGYDLLVSDDLGIWLCEINGVPDLSHTFPLKKEQTAVMFDDILRCLFCEADENPPKEDDRIGRFHSIGAIHSPLSNS